MVREIEIEKLNTAPYNPRIRLEPGMPEFEKLKNSVLQFGNVEPVVWNERTGNVIGGHQRLAVLRRLGYKTVPCSVVNLSENDEKLLNVALNKIKGTWDFEKLEEILSGFDYEVDMLCGFSAAEIAVILANDDDLSEDDDYNDWEDDDDIETVTGGSYVVTLIFQNGELAKEWAEREGYEGYVKQRATTTVIRIEE